MGKVKISCAPTTNRYRIGAVATAEDNVSLARWRGLDPQFDRPGPAVPVPQPCEVASVIIAGSAASVVAERDGDRHRQWPTDDLGDGCNRGHSVVVGP